MAEESTREAKLKRLVSKLGGTSLKWVSGITGVPDRIVLMPKGLGYLVEVKAVKGTIRPRQKLVAKQFAAMQHTVHMVTNDAELTAFIEMLKQHQHDL